MIRTLANAMLPLCLAVAVPALAQDPPPAMSAEDAALMQAYLAASTPGAPHQSLAKTAGEYDLAIRSWATPEAPPTVESGTATRTMALDGRVMVEQVKSQMHGQPFTGHGMTGYDNVTDKYWATWNDSMSTGVMVSEGDCDQDGTCTFTGSWHDPVSKQEVVSRMTSRWSTPSVEVFEMYAPAPDGKEMKMMEITYTKK